MKKIFLIAYCALFLVSGQKLFSANTDSGRKELTFFCGSADKVPMEEIIENYESERNVSISVVYGGSGSLLSQMSLSRKGDVYLSGSPDYITIGESKNLLIKDTAKKISYLIPAIIVPKSNPAKIKKLEDLKKKGIKIGIGNPESVCLGLYGIELLDYNNLLETVMPNVVVFAKSCEDTATLAALNKVDAIIGWDVFESWNPDAVRWIKIDKNKIPRIAYVAMAVPVFVKDRAAADDFINYVLSAKNRAIFKKWGYISGEKEAKLYAPKAKIGGEYNLPEKYYKIIKNEK